eukprot:6421611-Amphidinium_carterae.1
MLEGGGASIVICIANLKNQHFGHSRWAARGQTNTRPKRAKDELKDVLACFDRDLLKMGLNLGFLFPFASSFCVHCCGPLDDLCVQVAHLAAMLEPSRGVQSADGMYSMGVVPDGHCMMAC